MELNNQTKYMVENTNGVISFVGPKSSNPVPLRDEEIRRIFGEIERKDGREIEKIIKYQSQKNDSSVNMLISKIPEVAAAITSQQRSSCLMLKQFFLLK